MNLILAATLLLGVQTRQSPFQQSEALSIRNFATLGDSATVYEPFEVKADLKATFVNPFDPNQIDVKLQVEQPSGKTFSIPAFIYQPYTRKLENNKESLTAAGPTEWRARVSFLEPGRHRLSLIAKDKTGSTTTNTLSIDAKPAASPGFVQISPRDGRYFETSDGKAFFPIGSNVGWGGDKGLASYETSIPKFAAQGCNFIRIWLSPEWTTFGIDEAGTPKEGKGVGYFSLGKTWLLDELLALCKKNGIRVKLCFDSYNVLRDKDAYPHWEKSGYNSANGGPIDFPKQFWDSEEIDRIYRMKIRYLVARYSADPTVFAWEFWNEADLTRDFPVEKAKAWHQRMGRELSKLDPYDHLITTSFSNAMGVKDIDLLTEIDFIQTHTYNSPDVISQVAIQQSRKGSWNKPHYIGEIGADAEGPRATEDPTGLQIHDPLWISTCMGSSGAAMPWWWDNYIEPNNLYPLFGALSKFTQGIDWPGEAFRQTQPEIRYQTPPAKPLYKDLSFTDGPMFWDPHPSNRPRTVRVTDAGADLDSPLSGLLHGKRNHPKETNPVTFRTSFSKKTRMEILVDTVSGYGGAKLMVSLDGAPVLNRTFADPDDQVKTETLTQYRGTFTIDVPPGNHTVTIENPGNDWISIGYRFKDLIKRTNPPVIGWATVGETTAIAWLRVEDATWRRVCARKETIAPAPPTLVRLVGLASGTWRVQLWDTWTGITKTTVESTVGLDGILRVYVPTLEKDVAIKAVKIK